MTTQQVDQVNKDLVRYSGRTLQSGGDKSPLLEFKGHATTWDVRPSNFEGQAVNIILAFDRVEVLQLRNDGEPYPYDVAELTVKHSSAMRSGFGFFIASVNKSLGVPTDESDLDLFTGKNWHMKTEKFNWGKIPNSQSPDANGDTWGDIWIGELVGSTVLPNPLPQIVEAMTASERALGILNGKNKADFLTSALVHPDIRGDSSMISSIVNDSWLAGQIANGVVTANADGTYTVN